MIIQVTKTASQARPARTEILPTPPRQYIWAKADTVSTAVIALLALITRFVGLTSTTAENTPIFDEKHYVPQAWDIVQGGIESNPGFGLVVHPPLAKQLIAIGEAFFGYTPLGWRLMTAIFGVVMVLAIMALTRRVSGSWQIATFAGFIAVFDGVLLVSSRFGMLDIFQAVFVVGAAWMLVRDHQQVHSLFDASWRHQRLGSSPFGPRIGFRWWRFAAGITLGLSLAVKWSGLYYIAFFGLASVFADLWLRRRYRVRRYVTGTLLRDTPAALASLVLVPVLIYLWTWRSWFMSETAVYRHAKVDGTIASDSPLMALPEPIAGFFYYHASVLKFHASLTTSNGHDHPWDSKPWTWLVAGRPILYSSATDLQCLGGQSCRQMIYLFGTPIIWWAIIPVLLWSLWRVFLRRDFRYVVPLIGFSAGFLPWVATYDRQMYFFYAVPLIPFVIVALALTLGLWTHRGNPVRNLVPPGTTWGDVAVYGYLAGVLAMFIYFSPILYGYTIPDSYYNSIMWLPSWT
ncbi:MAG: phospholipid carrier-dependent glycosyltransferase [Corynebacterium sp.]|nr:phospholipid carrier-dependent glycosyltransferase [Corynebacterium sp.]